MPGFDGTGPRGEGPMTGRGNGYCAIAQPTGGRAYGYIGIQGTPVVARPGGFLSRVLPYIFGRRWIGGRALRRGRGRGW